MAPKDMETQKGKIPQGPTRGNEFTKDRDWEKKFSSEMSPLIGYPILSGQLWDHIHTSNINGLGKLFLCIQAHTHMCAYVYMYMYQ